MSVSRRRFLQSTVVASAAAATCGIANAAGLTDSAGFGMPISDRTRRIIDMATVESRRLSHQYVGSEHLLLAIARESEESESYWLNELCLSHEDIQCTVECLIPRETQGVLNAPQSENLKSIFSEAVRVAIELKADAIEPEHLLLGLVDTIGTKAVEVLEEMWFERGVFREVAHQSLNRLA